MAIQIPPARKVCGTQEAADIYGCTISHVRGMATRGEIWCHELSPRLYVYDVEEIRRLAAERAQLRRSGKLGGRRPNNGRQSA